jgi:hypothetical protein
MSEHSSNELKLDEETRRKLASGEYSISPNSGRLRKRIRVKEKKPFYSRRSFKKRMKMVLWILLLAGFVVTLIMVAPELNVSQKKKNEDFKKQIRGKY